MSPSPEVAGAAIGIAGILIGLWVNGDRNERQRRRDLHSRALAAVIDYGEMPFMIRRRRFEDDERSAERVRLSDHFSAVKAEMTTCQVLLAADGNRDIATAYNTLVETARETAGREAHNAWKEPPIVADEQMNMGKVFDRLEALRDELELFKSCLAQATRPRHAQLLGWFRGEDLLHSRRRVPEALTGDMRNEASEGAQ